MKHYYSCILCSDSFLSTKEVMYDLCTKCHRFLEEQFFNNIFKKNCPTCCIPLLTENNCVNCSEQIKSVIDNKQTCFLYTGLIKELIIYYKFRNIIQLSEFFSHYILKSLGDLKNHIILIPIPGNSKNIKKRGWDQVFEIAKRIKNERIVVHALLKQKKKHKQQKTLDKSQRIIHAKNKFTIDKKILENVLTDLKSFGDYKIFLIDDIITTGATLESAATVLIDALKVPIHAITLAMD